MAEAVLDEVEGEKCVCCLEENDIDLRKLPCGHIICSVCIDKWLDEQLDADDFKCPHCKAEHPNIKSAFDVPALKQNSKLTRTDQRDDVEMKSGFFCKPCGKPGLVFCVDCKLILCIQHNTNHDGLFMNHMKLGEGDYNIQKEKHQTEFCYDHVKREASRICVKCYKLVCLDCAETDSTRCDGVEVKLPAIKVPATPKHAANLPSLSLEENVRTLDARAQEISSCQQPTASVTYPLSEPGFRFGGSGRLGVTAQPSIFGKPAKPANSVNALRRAICPQKAFGRPAQPVKSSSTIISAGFKFGEFGATPSSSSGMIGLSQTVKSAEQSTNPKPTGSETVEDRGDGKKTSDNQKSSVKSGLHNFKTIDSETKAVMKIIRQNLMKTTPMVELICLQEKGVRQRILHINDTVIEECKNVDREVERQIHLLKNEAAEAKEKLRKHLEQQKRNAEDYLLQLKELENDLERVDMDCRDTLESKGGSYLIRNKRRIIGDLANVVNRPPPEVKLHSLVLKKKSNMSGSQLLETQYYSALFEAERKEEK